MRVSIWESIDCVVNGCDILLLQRQQVQFDSVRFNVNKIVEGKQFLPFFYLLDDNVKSFSLFSFICEIKSRLLTSFIFALNVLNRCAKENVLHAGA